MTRMPLPSRGPRGTATLPAALAVSLVMLLFMGIVNGSLLTEQRLSANHLRSQAAFEAAEAGIDWMLGRLNAGDPVDDRCEAQSSAALPSFREQHAGWPDAQGAWTPPGLPVNCTTEGAGWACWCGTLPAVGQPPPADTSAATSSATFTVQLRPGAPRDLLQVESAGCSNQAPPCASAAGRGDAQAQVAVSVGHVPALAHVPAAALTVHGDLHLGGAAWMLQRSQPAQGGMVLHTGGNVTADRLSLRGPPGAPAASTAVTSDPALRSADRGHTFSRLFRMDAASWQTLPTVHRVDCASACDSALRDAVGVGGHHTMLWLSGGLQLAGPLELGSPTRPVLIVADGPVLLAGPVVVHGFIYTTSPRWHAPAGAEVFGAVVAEGALNGSGVTHIRHDALVLQILHERTGTFLRVPGSWKDFE